MVNLKEISNSKTPPLPTEAETLLNNQSESTSNNHQLMLSTVNTSKNFLKSKLI